MCSIDSLFGGPSNQEKVAAGNETTLASDMEGDFNKVFGEQQSTLGQLKDELTRINTGDTGMGFSAEQNALLTTGIETGAAAEERNVEQAAQNRQAGLNQTGGVASGAQAAREAGIIAAGETAKARGLNAETLANINQGRANAQIMAGGLTQMADLESPTTYGSEASSANQAAFGEQDTINKEHGAAIGGLMNMGMDVASMGATGIMGAVNAPAGSSMLSGAMNALAG